MTRIRVLTNPVPAVAVIQGGLALFNVAGRTARVGGTKFLLLNPLYQVYGCKLILNKVLRVYIEVGRILRVEVQFNDPKRTANGGDTQPGYTDAEPRRRR